MLGVISQYLTSIVTYMLTLPANKWSWAGQSGSNRTLNPSDNIILDHIKLLPLC
jgi:hypothetical protein